MGLFRRKKQADAESNEKNNDTDDIARSHSSAVSTDKTSPDLDPLDRLEPAQREALLAQIETPGKKDVTFFGLMRYASAYDRVLQLVACLCAIGAGAALVRNHPSTPPGQSTI